MLYKTEKTTRKKIKEWQDTSTLFLRSRVSWDLTDRTIWAIFCPWIVEEERGRDLRMCLESS